MEYKLTKWNASNYEILIMIWKEDMENAKITVLRNFQKDMSIKWFRKWHVPLNIVEQEIKDEYIAIWTYEECIHIWLDKVINDNKDIKFIWNLYDLNQEEKNWKTNISFKLDIYPEVEKKDEKFKKIKLKKIDENVSDKEIQDALTNLKRQYATFTDTETITMSTVFKVKFEFLDSKGSAIDNWSTYFWEEDLNEFKLLEEIFINKNKWDCFEIKYEHDKLPHIIHYHKDDTSKPKKISFTIVDVKNKILPELTDENIVKFFWADDIKTLSDLENKIKELLIKQKQEQWLLNATEEIITQSRSSFKVIIPKTLIEEETKSRHESLKKRFWWDEWYKKYIENLWQEKTNEMNLQIQSASKESLEKFFILRTLVENFELKDINRDKPLDVEKKLYEKLTSN